MKVQETQVGLRFNGMAYENDVNLLGDNRYYKKHRNFRRLV
jgi:hypothetical protein